MKRAVLIHGWDGRPHNHWFPWLQKELENRGFQVIAPLMPNPPFPTRNEWVAKLVEVIGSPDSNTYIVGHSLGCIATVRYIETLSVNSKLGGCVFVGGFSGNISFPQLATFYEDAGVIDFDAIRAICPKFSAIFSEDDDVVPLEKASEFARKLKANIVVEKDKGHFTKSDGVTELPAALEAVLRFSA